MGGGKTPCDNQRRFDPAYSPRSLTDEKGRTESSDVGPDVPQPPVGSSFLGCKPYREQGGRGGGPGTLQGPIEEPQAGEEGDSACSASPWDGPKAEVDQGGAEETPSQEEAGTEPGTKNATGKPNE